MLRSSTVAGGVSFPPRYVEKYSLYTVDITSLSDSCVSVLYSTFLIVILLLSIFGCLCDIRNSSRLQVGRVDSDPATERAWWRVYMMKTSRRCN